MKVRVLQFEEAIKKANDFNKKHLLLGNGFSISLNKDAFTYGALFKKANFSKLNTSARKIFDLLETTDFEVVMRALKQASKFIDLYMSDGGQSAQLMIDDADSLREVLVQAIAGSHPERPYEIGGEKYSKCKTFLAKFDSIYTLNYDLLLYWTLMQNEIDPPITFDDGFRTPNTGATDYVTWDVEKTDKQNIHYLHGALHIFDAGSEIHKYTWVNTQVPLIEQIRKSLNEEKYPIFVSEGNSSDKLKKIMHQGILHRSYRSFSKIGGVLFVFGHSLSAQDDHILEKIEHGRINHIFIGLHGDPDSAANQKIVARANQFVVKRRGFNRTQSLEVSFYDSDSAHVWQG